MDDFYFKIRKKSDELTNGEQLLIFLKKSDMDGANIELLTKIMAALKLLIDSDCKILEVTSDMHASPIVALYSHILIFGLEPDALGLNLTHKFYRLNRLEDKKIIFAHSLSDLKTDDQKKAALWKSLQLMFDLIKK